MYICDVQAGQLHQLESKKARCSNTWPSATAALTAATGEVFYNLFQTTILHAKCNCWSYWLL